MKFQFGCQSKHLTKPGLNNAAARPRGYFRQAKVRKQRGNMIAFIAAVTLGLVLAILFFALKYTRMLGSNQEQRTAIEGAALQVANDISRIVYEDPNFGIIALSDFAPIGANTLAADGQPTPVRGINTVLATVRLDMIIADAVNNSQMQSLALADYNNAVKANNNLQAALVDACSTSPQSAHLDWDGNPVNVYSDALFAYNQNIIRMSGSQSALDASSLKITLGIVAKGAATNTAVPQPANYSNVSSSQTQVETINNVATTVYKSYTNIPYDSKPFVFAGVDNSLKLIDIGQFSTNVSALPYSLTSVVKVEGDQVYQPDNNAPGTRVHSVACAQPASAGDPRPFPGALVIGFPSGVPPEIKAPITILTDPFLSGIPVRLSTSNSGDNNNTPIIPTGTGGYPTMGSGFGTGGYHWLRRAGTKPNVSAVLSMLNKQFNTIPGYSATTGAMFVYAFDSTGIPQPSGQTESATRQILTSNHQLTGKSRITFSSSNGTAYGATMSDMVAIPGSTYGGTHAGEPLLLGTTQATGWSAGQSISAVGGIIGGVLTPIAWLLALLNALLSSLGITTLLNWLLGVPPASSGWSAAAVRPPNVVRPPNSSAARVARDSYTQQGLAVDLEFPKAPAPVLNAW